MKQQLSKINKFISRQTKTTNRLTALVVVLLVVAIGTYLLISSHAQVPFISLTASSGSTSGGATSQACAGTSGSTCVVFNGTSGGGGGQTTNCNNNFAACGYPDPSATSGSSVVGPVNTSGDSVSCSSLTPAGSITSTSANQTIAGENISGYVVVTSSNVTLNNDCITSTGGGSNCTNSTGDSSHPCFPFYVQSGSATVNNTTVTGANSSSESIIGVASNGNPATLNHDYIYNCTECIHDSLWTVNNSYVNDNGNNTAHPEDVYMSDTSFNATHDTFIAGANLGTVAVFFGNTNGGNGGACSNQWTVKNSFLTLSNNGNYIVGACYNSSSAGPTATLDFENNDFGTGGGNCGDGGIVADTTCTELSSGEYGAYCSGLGSRLTWTGNFRDSNGAEVYCSTSGNAPTGP